MDDQHLKGLRPYQTDAMRLLVENLAAGRRRLLFAHPTGSGKNFILTRLPYLLAELSPNPRCLVLTHLTTIREDIHRRIKEYNGKLAADERRTWSVLGEPRFNRNAKVVVAMMQNKDALLANFRRGDFGSILIDEAHHSLADTYIDILRHFGAFKGDPNSFDERINVIGVTATPFRTDERDMAYVWDSCPGPAAWGGLAHRVIASDLIEEGYLVPAHGVRVKVDLNHDVVGEDLDDVRLQDYYTSPGLNQLVVETYLTRFPKPRQTLVYCASIEQVNLLTELFNVFFEKLGLAAKGHQAAALHSRVPGRFSINLTDDEVHDLTLQEQFKAGKLRVLVSCQMLGEGFDAPNAEIVVIAKRTRSHVQWIQNLGRGMRPCPSPEQLAVNPKLKTKKKRVIVLDFFDNITHFLGEGHRRNGFVRDIFSSLTTAVADGTGVTFAAGPVHAASDDTVPDLPGWLTKIHALKRQVAEEVAARRLAQAYAGTSADAATEPKDRTPYQLLRKHFGEPEVIQVGELLMKTVGVDIRTAELPKLMKSVIYRRDEYELTKLINIDGLPDRVISILTGIHEHVVEAFRAGDWEQYRPVKLSDQERAAVLQMKAQNPHMGGMRIGKLLGLGHAAVESVLCRNNSKDSAKQAERERARYQDPEYRARRNRLTQLRRQDPAVRARKNEQERLRAQDPEVRARRRERDRLRWLDPDVRAKAAERRRRRLQAQQIEKVATAPAGA